MTRIYSLLLFSTLAMSIASCRSGEPEPPSAAESTAADSTATESTAGDSEAGDSTEVAYEPAYPADVSSEGLTEDDVAQHEARHSHGDGEHSHDDGHSHDGGDHTHDDGKTHDDHDD